MSAAARDHREAQLDCLVLGGAFARARVHGFRVGLGFRVLGFRVLGFRVLGFRV